MASWFRIWRLEGEASLHRLDRDRVLARRPPFGRRARTRPDLRIDRPAVSIGRAGHLDQIAVPLNAERQLVVVLRRLLELLGLTGLRVGTVLGPPLLHRRLVVVREFVRVLVLDAASLVPPVLLSPRRVLGPTEPVAAGNGVQIEGLVGNRAAPGSQRQTGRAST
jgi:hypothetical protein